MNVVIRRQCHVNIVNQVRSLVKTLKEIFKDEYEIIVTPKEDAHIETDNDKVVYVTIDGTTDVEEFVNKMKDYAKKMGENAPCQN